MRDRNFDRGRSSMRRGPRPREGRRAGAGDRPDPHARPHARVHGRARRRAESSLDPETVRIGRHAPSDGSPPHALSIAPTPRPRAGTFGGRGSPVGADCHSPPAPAPHLNRRPDGPRGAPAGWRARRRPSGGAHEDVDHAIDSGDPD